MISLSSHDQLLLQTMWPCDLAPDDSDLGASNLLLSTIYKSDLFAEIESKTNSVSLIVLGHCLLTLRLLDRQHLRS